MNRELIAAYALVLTVLIVSGWGLVGGIDFRGNIQHVALPTTTTTAPPTTTSTIATTTTTSTSSTTTTNPPVESYWSATYELPDGNNYAAGTPFSGSAGTMYCSAWIAPETKSGLTKLVWRTNSTASPTGTFGAAIYHKTGDPKYGAGTVAYSAQNTVYVVTLSPSVALTAGTEYLVCWCSTTTTHGYASLNDSTHDNFERDFANAWTVRIGTAANSCDGSGNPPNTTGSLSSSDFATLLFLLGE